ncbi:GntR family transcriptional regulator [Granulosicoccus sp. 3-233]|uniref:GntR family transcriptional regulator n=1 Tax=Granulosicoccus sp. 3-233 TaxID=3417969 RepID=UPI003D329C9A
MAQAPEQSIVGGVLEAIAEHRLKAGVKLGEQDLCEIYHCNRAHVRRALATLEAQKVVKLEPNRGAFIATPTPEEARNVFQARRAIELVIARNVLRLAGPEDIARLRDHVEQEHAARQSSERRDAIRLSGRFHLILGEMCGNEVLDEFLNELVMRSSLIISMYSASQAPLCGDEEHARIVDAIEAGEESVLMERIEHHLRHLEHSIAIEPANTSPDLKDILQPPGP